jgi:hypothetical protein
MSATMALNAPGADAATPSTAEPDGADPAFASTLTLAPPPVDPLVQRVVAWHNAHPLAWKIEPRHVVSIGHVWLPFEAPAGRGGRPGSRRGWKAAFSDNFIAPLRPRTVARWALKHGWQPEGGDAAAGAVRAVDADNKHANGPLETLWLATAAIELGATRRRVLIGHAIDLRHAPVLGPRVWRRRLVAGVLASSSAVAGAAVAVLAMQIASLLRPPAEVAPVLAQAPVATSAAMPASVASASDAAASAPAMATSASAPGALIAEAPATVASAVPALTAAPAAAPAVASAAASGPATLRVALAPPEPAPPAPPSREKPRLVTPLDDAAKAAARAALTAAREARDEDRRARGLPPLPAPGDAPVQAAAHAASAPNLIAQAAAARETWALTSRVLRTRAESERMLLALRAAGIATKPAAKSEQLVFEVLSVGDDWRAVGYPFATRAAAERARALLAQRGITVQVAAF